LPKLGAPGRHVTAFHDIERVFMKTNLTSLLTAIGSVLCAVANTAWAADDPLSFNASVVSDYRYRGISQIGLKPALQGGADYVSPSGFYVGAWGSTIKWIKDNGVMGSVELDLYGGYRG
jgi:uncharacterized protein (TIGR02001 family)